MKEAQNIGFQKGYSMKPRLLVVTAVSLAAAGSLVLTGCQLGAEAEAPPVEPAAATNSQAVAATNAAPAPGGEAAANTNAENPEVAAAAAAAPGAPAEEAAAPAPVAVPAPPQLSPGALEIVQLAQARVGDPVLLVYVERSKTPYRLQVNDVLYLQDLGISDEVIAAMLRHDGDTEGAAAVVAEAAEEAPAEATPPAEMAVPAETAAPVEPPAPTVAAAAPEPAAEPAAAPAVAEAPAQPVTYNYFYNTLSPYGAWREVPDYGWCWQPTVAVIDVGWQPYCHGGRWVWTDCGWYWHSYYTWGWAPFHYGRWHCHARWGWLWMPDTCWGPAWVTWRHHRGYHGWAPLPPHSVYVAGTGFLYHGRRVSVGFGFGLPAARDTFVSTGRFHSAARAAT